MSQAHVRDAWTRQRNDLSYFHYVKHPQPKSTTEDGSAVPAQRNPQSYPQLLHHYYHGPLNRGKASFLTKYVVTSNVSGVCAKLHYTDTGYGHVVQHHQRTSSQQFYNLLYNKFTTNGPKFATSQCQSSTSRHVKMLGCGKSLSVGGEFVVQQVVEFL